MKLTDLYQSLDSNDRKLLAHKAGVDAGYLWQIATRWRGKKPSLDVIQRLVFADSRLTTAELVSEFTSDSQEITHV
ncbi:hypothetical protein GCM10027278_38120 [Paralcaligenes ginsengisoli]